jgi:hypothetical protein
MALTAEQQKRAGGSIAAWRANPLAPLQCPACGKPGLGIVDRSARPHAEWYALSCAACGMSETLHIALGATIPKLD